MDCGKYRGVRLLEHGMRVYEYVLEKRLRKILDIRSYELDLDKAGQIERPSTKFMVRHGGKRPEAPQYRPARSKKTGQGQKKVVKICSWCHTPAVGASN